MTFTVVGLGEVLWDLLPTGPQLGGAPTNFTYQAAALGAQAMMVTRVGDDDLGREVMRRFLENNLSGDTVQVDRTRPTGTVAVTLDEEGVPHYTFAEDAAWERLVATDVAMQAVRGAHAVCFGTLAQRSETSRGAIQQLVAAAPAHALKIFDVNLRLPFYSREVIDQSLRLSNILKMNDEELAVMTSMYSLHGDVRERIEQLACAFGFKVVVVTCGASGSLIHQEGSWSVLHSQATPVVDTVGAGDAFAAALAMGLLAGMSFREVHVVAAELARYVCCQYGATPSLPKGFRDRLDRSSPHGIA
ncbi:carbohydrate kinase [Steroidobacter sp. S1-65]|uniref:Carbohydrate kinase n=1 Tax=Steroidobacter gossypii TaxID=2805490 RepID=A0ABS1X6N7_9GAMM|nr:carbohydrate kinase [Steroidobacter gossypii]MBM0108883.1 carbohydrate kinase [Steroidobacter gossypii]